VLSSAQVIPEVFVAEVASGYPAQRRRSERVSKSLPVIVRGIDLLGQPFEERTSTLALNLHGCRYASKHHLPKNTWVTLEVPEGAQRRHVRARVAWIQRPHSVREFFQIAVELETPGNIWNFSSPPTDWETVASRPAYVEPERYAEPAISSVMANFIEGPGPDMTNEPASTAQASSESAPMGESPLLRQWSAELERQAAAAADAAAARSMEQIDRRMEEFARLENETRDNFAAQTAAKQQELVEALRAEFESGFHHVRNLLRDLDRTAEVLRAESQAAQEATSHLAQARLHNEAAEAARAQLNAQGSEEARTLAENDVAAWRQRLESEMAAAQAQWNELLQSSLDGSIDRLVEQLSGRSHELLRSTEQRMAERFAEIRQPLSQMYAEARDTLGSVRSALEDELGRARSSLGDIEHATTRMKEYAAQLEATSHETLNEMHRRLENILQTQSDEMSRRAEHTLASVPQRLSANLDSLGHQVAEQTIAEIDAKLAPRIEQAAELLRNLTSREAYADEGLRLHRERLRQVSENSLRDAAARTAEALSGVHGEFESARKEALAKWNEELDASAVRASHTASESIGRSSEWLQQEARSRLQVLVEQSIATAAAGFEEKAAEAGRQLEAKLEEQTAGRAARIHEQLDGVAAEITGRTRTQLDEAAEAAAASFGEVLRRVSEQEVETFNVHSRNALAERERDLGRAAEQLIQNLESNAQASTERFRAQMASQLEETVAQGRGALAAEFTSALDAHRAEREAHQRSWTEELHRLNEEAVAKHQERLQTAGDSWVVSSVRRLNEHGQDAIETLMRSADQSLRESCARLFAGLSEMLRDRPASSPEPSGFGTMPGPVVEGTPGSPGESATGANA
jgi:hypothetical protein